MVSPASVLQITHSYCVKHVLEWKEVLLVLEQDE